MTQLTGTRRIAFNNAAGEQFTITRNGGSKNPGYLYKTSGDSRHDDRIAGTEDIVEIVRAALIEGYAVRSKNLANGSQIFQRFREDELTSYEIGPEIAEALGIPTEGHAGEVAYAISRRAVEEAMDAHVRFQETGQHSDVYGKFGEPGKYWVRSTRQRPQPLFPSKAIVGFASPSNDLSGGWSSKSTAATRLHNSGFIIVDDHDRPIAPPSDKTFLIRDADRIRLFALNYFIEPARERGEKKVSIRAGELSDELLLKEAWPNVCQSLKGKKFQELARVPPPLQEGPDESTTTTFTFDLRDNADHPAMNSEVSKQMQKPTNLILYGPPGTGKTYATAWEAVRLCLGGETAAALHGSDNRDALMTEYQRLVEARQIEFVTFHQSMSYEEFVEGLRPETGMVDASEAPDEAQASSGFRLVPQDGIFKRISEKARLDVGDAPQEKRLDRSRSIFRLGLTGNDWQQDLEHALEEGVIDTWFGGEIDWSDPKYENWSEIKARRQKDEPKIRGNHWSIYGNAIVRSFAETGDYIVLTVGKKTVVAFGRIVGNYEFIPSTQETGARHRRTVQWLWHDAEGVDRSDFYATDFTAYHPIYNLKKDELDWDGLEATVFGSEATRPSAEARPSVLIIDEINRANISKVFGELITLLEPDKRLGAENEIRVRLPYSKKLFGVPRNLHIIGTMNTADRSIALLDTALRRRFTFRELMPDPSVLSMNLGGINLQALLRKINDRIEYLFDREHQIGHAYLTGCQDRQEVEEVMRYKIIPLLAEYFYEDWSKVAAVLGDGNGSGDARFLEARKLSMPAGFVEDELGEEKLRWTLKTEFDFSEFEV